MRLHNTARTLASFGAAVALLAGITTGAHAATFGVSTTIAASCIINSGGPAALTPTYSGPTDLSVGSATTLNTTCNTASPTVAFTDPTGAGTVFIMHAGVAVLNYQISNRTSCSGIVGDNAIPQATTESLVTGVSQVYNICAAVIPGQMVAAVGSYTDTVTLTIDAGA
jgi:spore coat protein U-like protein